MSETQETGPPLVSVVLATYQGDSPGFVKEAVKSILGQTHERLELHVVLDGPVPGETAAYLDETAARDRRVRVLALPENLGPACARNAGIRAAQGAYVAIIDADDVAAADRIEKQVAFIQSEGADVVGCFYRLLDEAGADVGEKQVPLSPRAVRDTLYLFNPIANSTVLARSEVLKRYPYIEGRRSGTASFDGEDYALWVTLALDGAVLCNQPEYLASLRTGRTFLARRRGLRPFYTDLRTKLRTLPLYPFYMKPLVIVGGFGTAILRLLPAGLLDLAYRLRGRLRFGQKR